MTNRFLCRASTVHSCVAGLDEGKQSAQRQIQESLSESWKVLPIVLYAVFKQVKEDAFEKELLRIFFKFDQPNLSELSLSLSLFV